MDFINFISRQWPVDIANMPDAELYFSEKYLAITITDFFC